MAHAFRLKQVVDFLPGPGELAAERGRHEVTRLLPQDGGEWQYHVRGANGGAERRVRESQLRALPGPWSAPRSSATDG
jgi:hypothetical protein